MKKKQKPINQIKGIKGYQNEWEDIIYSFWDDKHYKCVHFPQMYLQI